MLAIAELTQFCFAHLVNLRKIFRCTLTVEERKKMTQAPSEPPTVSQSIFAFIPFQRILI